MPLDAAETLQRRRRIAELSPRSRRGHGENEKLTSPSSPPRRAAQASFDPMQWTLTREAVLDLPLKKEDELGRDTLVFCLIGRRRRRARPDVEVRAAELGRVVVAVVVVAAVEGWRSSCRVCAAP